MEVGLKGWSRFLKYDAALLTLIALALGFASARPGAAQSPRFVTPSMLKALHWRSIGPAVFGGRVVSVAGVPGDPNIIYVAHSSAGLFKSVDGGVTFHSIFNHQDVLSMGAVAIDPQNPSIVYAGTGEGNPRNSASFGDGVYRSTDGGKTWQHLGLDQTQRIARIAIDPQNPRIVLVAAMGDEWLPNPERGVYRSADGGKSWKRVLFVNDTTGASDVTFDPSNPEIAYAGMYDYLRKPWHLRSGGPGSGLYRSTDGGATWVCLTDPKLHNGLPPGPISRVGVAVSPSDPEVVYAFVPSKEGLLWRSGDGGATWRMVNKSPRINLRPFYFSVVRVDPTNANRVYAISGGLFVSNDGGKTFKEIAQRIHGDYHDLWIDPKNPQRMLCGSDGGFQISYDRGRTWDFINTQPFAQVYRLGYDLAVPYHVIAGFQDNEVWRGPSTLWNVRGSTNGDWKRVLDWGDGQYAMADPRDPNIVYEDSHFGDIRRVDVRTGEERYITPYPVLEFGAGVGQFKYRFNWSAPVYISPHDPNTIYLGGNVLFKTSDGGESWSIVSPDLTTHNPRMMRSSGGPVTQDDTNAEAHCTIYAISEDAKDSNTLWVGTDDGNLQLTRDGGKHWTNVVGNIPGLPPGSWVSSVHASRTIPGRAYVSFDRHQLGDFAPYAYVTSDYGKSWKNISQGLRGYVHVIREDPRQPNLIYAGTELGVFASFDGGEHWTDLQLGLPPLPVDDLAIQPRANDLLIGTHGRGIYILDDATPLEQLAAALSKPAALFKPMPAYRYVPAPDTGDLGNQVFIAKNRPYGALLSYYLAPKGAGSKSEAQATSDSSQNPPGETVKLEIFDAQGKLLRTLKGTDRPGVNRVIWDLREAPPGGAHVVQDPRPYYVYFSLKLRGPLVLPGNYTVKLIARGETLTQAFRVILDPRLKVSRADLIAEQDAVEQLLEMQERAEVAVRQMGSVLKQLAPLEARLEHSTLKAEAAALGKSLKAREDELREDQDGYRAPARIIEQLAYLRMMIERSTNAPTAAEQMWIAKYQTQLASVLATVQTLLTRDVQQLNAHLRSAHVPYLSVAAPGT